MHRFSYASLLVSCGMFRKAMTVAKSVRARFDGRKRNPFNEFECGSNYTRSMASYGLLAAMSGFKYDHNNGMLGFASKTGSDLSCFWALGDVWGTVSIAQKSIAIEFLHGEFELKEFKAEFPVSSFELNGRKVCLPLKLKEGDCLKIS